MKLALTSEPIADVGSDLVALLLADGDELPGELKQAPGAADVTTASGKLTLLRPKSPLRVLVVGLGPPDGIDVECLRVAAALATKQAGSHEARSIAWVLPSLSSVSTPEIAGALVEGTTMAAWSFDRFLSRDPDEPPSPKLEQIEMVVSAAERDAVGVEAEAALVAAVATNRARDLQSLPSNELDPQALAKRAEEIAAAHENVSVEVLDREAIAGAGMGGLVAVSQGTAAEPRLIALRYGGGGGGKRYGLVGKAVTFDSGGISIKPSEHMEEMKMDMSGGAAVLEGFAAIAELGLELDLVAVIPSTENMPSATAIKPGDIITQLNGKTVEVNNTDAEGRLILADALTYCVREMGAERIVDIATLTGAVVVALGSTYAALISNDDDWAATVASAAAASGELAWRLPLHPEYKQLTKGTIADLTNAAAQRKAGTIYAGSFLEEFVDETPWVHLDIAGTAWDTGREYVGKGPTGFGVRLLVRLARELSA